ncbi:MAG: 5-(carboxyamino)imidazole ribonucleotide mutase [Clostridia bacterium]|nr:5-(carboxyamino)imidazole ribonucleotide mutase [Clostridia bacterium]
MGNVKNKPMIGIIMGSDSDLPVMQEAAAILDSFGVSYEMKIISAHRAPDLLFEYCRSAAGRGIKTFIAGAGGAAHLPGVVAALTVSPVIGVPIQSKALNGVDSLYSIVQMPSGVPVATVAIDGAKNAGILAVQILAVGDPTLLEKLAEYKKSLEKMVIEKAKLVEQL